MTGGKGTARCAMNRISEQPVALPQGVGLGVQQAAELLLVGGGSGLQGLVARLEGIHAGLGLGGDGVRLLLGLAHQGVGLVTPDGDLVGLGLGVADGLLGLAVGLLGGLVRDALGADQDSRMAF